LPIAISALGAEGQVKQQREVSGMFVGSIGCKSSSCHGGAGEKRSQFITWSRQDFHTRSYAILLDARSTRIAEAVGIGDAPSNTRCTVCHSPMQSIPPERFAPAGHPDEGVSCESCHGAAGSWLRGHTRPDWTYGMRVSAGMHDLRNLYMRANACVACHQNVDHDILKAGHPTLLFELDSQSINEPRHWTETDSWSGARAWLAGQATALREAVWRARNDADPAPDMQETSLALGWLLAKVTITEPLLPQVVEPTTSDLEPLQKEADDLARRAVTWNPTIDSAGAMIHNLAETDSEFVVGKDRSIETLFYRARRLVLALDRLTAALNQNREGFLKLELELNALRQDVANAHGNLDTSKFAEHLRALRQKL
jgi:hypothetical protein